jgi:hypothetical protein
MANKRERQPPISHAIEVTDAKGRPWKEPKAAKPKRKPFNVSRVVASIAADSAAYAARQAAETAAQPRPAKPLKIEPRAISAATKYQPRPLPPEYYGDWTFSEKARWDSDEADRKRMWSAGKQSPGTLKRLRAAEAERVRALNRIALAEWKAELRAWELAQKAATKAAPTAPAPSPSAPEIQESENVYRAELAAAEGKLEHWEAALAALAPGDRRLSAFVKKRAMAAEHLAELRASGPVPF